MRVLLFGPTGQVGTELRLLSEEAGWDLRPVGRAEVDLTVPGRADLCILDEAPDAVVNASAYNLVDKAESEPAVAEQVNGRAPGEMAAACHRLDIPFLHMSTDFVFDGAKPGAYVETDGPHPLSAYGRSKRAGEEAVRAAAERHVILRTAWVFSEHGSNFVKTMLRLGMERDSLGVVNDQHGCPTSAMGIAGAIRSILDQWAANGAKRFGTFHYCGGEPVTWYEFAQAVFDAAGAHVPKALTVKPIGTADYPTAAQRPLNSVLSCEKIADVYGIAPNDWRQDLNIVVKRLVD